MDFFTVNSKLNKNGVIELSPNFIVGRSHDLMVKAKSFYAIWNESTGLWSTDEYDVQKLVDARLYDEAKKYEGCTVKAMRNFDSDQWTQFRRFVSNISDNANELDTEIVFKDQETTKGDYATKKLSYSLNDEHPESWDKIISTLYSPEERQKIEWAIGSIFAGASKHIQKFVVFYGPPGTGKSTIMKIIRGLFDGYTATFDARSLGQSNAQFATSMFKDNPLVAIQDDGDLSKTEDNTKLNSIVSHEDMIVNEKNKPMYTIRANAFLFMGTNQPVKISDAKSGLIRRLIDVSPTGNTLSHSEYRTLMNKIKFEYGSIANHCLKVFNELGEFYYDDYRPIDMMYKTDPFLNFVSDNYDIFKAQEYTTAKQAYDIYKTYCDEVGVDKPLSRTRFQSELSNYFERFADRYETPNGDMLRSVFIGFDFDKYKPISFEVEKEPILTLSESHSRLDALLRDCKTQEATADGYPPLRWENVTTLYRDIDTRSLHYVQLPKNHIVVDFDIAGHDGKKDKEANLRAASLWPPTYAEFSKSGNGVHLHYTYTGDVDELDNVYSDGIEIKVFRGNASLRRKFTYCNNLDVASISSGLPIKEKKDTVDREYIASEKGLRKLVERNLRKEIHPGTKPSIDFIKKILDDAHQDGLAYDLSDMRGDIAMFAAKSTNHAAYCMRVVKSMPFKNVAEPETLATKELQEPHKNEPDSRIMFFDVEVFKNLFIVVWKYEDCDQFVRMINPTPQEIESLISGKLVGFNNRRYDNHILYARYMNYTNEALYDLSQRIIRNDRSALFGAAYNLSYTDIYDFSSKKQSLKKWEYELGIKHVENHHDWDKPLPEEHWEEVIRYCENDVAATEAVFKHLKGDFAAREILSDLSGLDVNQTTQAHTARIIFGTDQNPQSRFVYTNLATGERSDGKEDSVKFEGYKYDFGKSTYKGRDVGEGGYVFARPGVHKNVALIDVASMHPNSIRNLDLFGPYTKNFTDLVDARVAIKHGDVETAAKMLDGKLAPYLTDKSNMKELAYALKIVINIVYGLTSAKFDNKFRDNRNKDNIVAKRGALFMIDLCEAVEAEGYTVAHIKTDSIKIPDADEYIIQFVKDFGRKYGYDFEHEATYEKMCLVNNAVYVAKYGWSEDESDIGKWTATGAQFQHPYVFKSMFTGEPIDGEDYIEAKSVSKGSIYMCPPDLVDSDDFDSMTFVGRAAQLVPVNEGHPAARVPYRVHEGKKYAVAGTSGHLWAEATLVDDAEYIDMSYFDNLVDEAKATINKFGDYEEFKS